ncbi:hypothetical protein A1Q1_04314 [Trichosporon asahii var. asahii CBS 2479]|uniref:Uncharacterized protein n=1 Tax=Trichosporon asahii var. asahii (strain ATCC 90039 / CBS 2479 / JCM 2466 / KCTC 7840 / NBRC 103889/ NCYC 2677 / UAMH 7654) TaxID=1186058 RepID=J6ER16_TRIAS|nr:hypothetical protein A1Q1_04314 [Trichosporon asahii var. asahii CBS 2479]EJT46944.1 hypothetical protein A1Q1_04314 [Trichosporon asahii var. asahii CBS 2479]
MEAGLLADGLPLGFLKALAGVVRTWSILPPSRSFNSANEQAYPFPAFVVEIPDRSQELQHEQAVPIAPSVPHSSPSSGTCGSVSVGNPFTPSPSHPTLPLDTINTEEEAVIMEEEDGEEAPGAGAGKPQLDSLLSRWSGGSYLSTICPIDLAVPDLARENSRERGRRWSSFNRSVQFVDGKGIPAPSQASVQSQRVSTSTNTSARRDSEKSQTQSEKKPAQRPYPRPHQQNEYFDHEAVSPLSHPAQLSPLSPLLAEPSLTPPRILWTNKQYDNQTARTPLNELVDPSALSSFRAWLLGSGVPSPEFKLNLGTGISLDLIKTIQTGIQNTTFVTGGLAAAEAAIARPDRGAPAAYHTVWTPTRRATNTSSVDPEGKRPAAPAKERCRGALVLRPAAAGYEVGGYPGWTNEGLAARGTLHDPVDLHVVGPGLNLGRKRHALGLCTSMVDHPRAFGSRMEDVWRLFWPELKPLVDRAWAGEPIVHENDRILFELKDELGGPSRYLEKYHSFSFLPIMDSNENVIAIYNPTADNSERILAERRLDTTRELVEHIAMAKTTKQFFESVAEVLEHNPADAPFAICYSVKEKEAGDAGDKAVHDLLGRKRLSSHHGSGPSSTDSPASTMSGTIPPFESKQVTLVLESSVGVPKGHKCAPAHKSITISKGGPGRAALEHFHPGTHRRNSPVPVRSSLHWSTIGTRRNEQAYSDGLEWPIARALASRQCVVVHNIGSLIEGLPVRQWNDLPDTAIIVPMSSESSDHIPPGVMILGLNLYRPLDGEYEDWVQQIRGHLSAALNSAIANEKELKRRIDQEKLDRAKTAWFRGVAQEFRSPLTLISGPLEDLSHEAAKDMDVKQRRKLIMAKKNVFKLEQLVTSLLDFSKIELGKFKIHYFVNNLKFWLRELFDLFKPTISKIGKLTFELDMDQIDRREKELIYFDPILLEMVVSNLLSHSIKNCGQKDRQTTITLKLQFDEQFANISVIDTGDGVSNINDVESPTDWFQPADDDDDEKNLSSSSSSGISLALVKEIVRLHQGQLRIESRGASDPQHGNTITARIPLKYHLAEDELGSPAESPVVEDGEDSFDHDAPQAASFGVYGKQVAKELSDWNEDLGAAPEAEGAVPEGLMFEKDDVVLVVDEMKDIRDYIKDLFEPYCTVLEASNGYEALELIQAGQKPSIVICDLLMRKLTGLELLSELRATAATQFVPVVFLSPVNDDDLRVSAFMAGAEDFIIKPFKPKELLLRVHLHTQIGKKRENLESLFAQRTQEMAVLSDYCPSGILRSDGYGNIIYANEAFREPAGMSLETNANDWISYVCPDQARSFERSWRALLDDTGAEMTTKLEWRWKTGKTMSGTFINLRKLNQNLSGILACVTDISYKEEMLVEAENRRIQAEESKRHQELLVDLTSHEIRTPVSAILQCSSLVKENLCSLMDQMKWALANDVGFVPTPQTLLDLEEDVDALESIFTCGAVQERIANDILSLARIQLDMLSLHDVEMDMQHEARKKLSVFASEARMKNIDIDLQFDESLDRLGVYGIKTDPVRLGQVVTNLISNAIRFTANSHTRKISVLQQVAYEPPLEGSTKPPPSAGLDKQYPVPPPEDTPIYLYVTVTDTGPGMSASEQELLFQRFQQGNKMIHTRYGGSGLGLFICKKITEMLGGGISVESKLGEGTRFYFYIKTRTVSPGFRLHGSNQGKSPPTPLPMSPSLSTISPLTPAMELVPSSMNGELKPPTPVAPSGPPLRVLIVEDNLINQTVLKRQLTKAGMTCDVAGNGEEALKLLRKRLRPVSPSSAPKSSEGAYDVVLMDLEMPIMDGWTAIKILRASENPALQSQLVIALTGNAREGQIVEALKAGMDHVIIKPYKLDRLIEKMRGAVAERKGKGKSGKTAEKAEKAEDKEKE